jgi:hypothetical protein
MFAVRWTPSALRDFAELTLLHPGRWNDINAADNDIDAKLRRDPTKYGQHLSEGLWRITSQPLAVYYIVDANLVEVTSVSWSE